MSREELLTAVEENPEAVFELFATHIPEARYKRDQYMRRMCFDVPVPFFNGVALSKLTIENSDALIDEAMAEMNATGLPWSWQVGPSARPFDLTTRLHNHGMRFSHEMPIMVANLMSWKPSPLPKSLQIIEIDDLETFDKFLEIVEVAFGLPLSDINVIRRAQIGVGFAKDAPIRNFLGLLDGEPVSSGMVAYFHGIAGIYTIGTPPIHRGKGYGSALTQACMSDAKTRGLEAAFLQSSKMGFSVYQKVGFQEICKLAIYVPVEP